jgi:uncharacterized membrane protein
MDNEIIAKIALTIIGILMIFLPDIQYYLSAKKNKKKKY